MDFLSFKNFLLTQGGSLIVEGISPSPIEYGNDLLNKMWLTLDTTGKVKIRKDKRKFSGEMKYTFCQIKDKYYQIYIIKNEEVDAYEFGFVVSDSFNKIYAGDMNYLVRYFSYDRSNYSNAITVFNNMFYIFLQGISKFNLKRIVFKGSDLDLGNLYTKLVKNEKFIAILKDNGFELVESTGVYFIFSKIER